jgi:hypothetical protein
MAVWLNCQMMTGQTMQVLSIYGQCLDHQFDRSSPGVARHLVGVGTSSIAQDNASSLPRTYGIRHSRERLLTAPPSLRDLPLELSLQAVQPLDRASFFQKQRRSAH